MVVEERWVVEALWLEVEGRYRVKEELFTGDGVHLIGREREYLDVCVMYAVGVSGCG